MCVREKGIEAERERERGKLYKREQSEEGAKRGGPSSSCCTQSCLLYLSLSISPFILFSIPFSSFLSPNSCPCIYLSATHTQSYTCYMSVSLPFPHLSLSLSLMSLPLSSSCLSLSLPHVSLSLSLMPLSPSPSCLSPSPSDFLFPPRRPLLLQDVCYPAAILMVTPQLSLPPLGSVK